ncbi:MAG TPA: hypothetical protein VF491_24850 [Vicinamibacterales bacterium]
MLIAVLFAIVTRKMAGPLGVLGGGALIGLSFWAIRGTVDALMASGPGVQRGSADAAPGVPRRSAEGAKAGESGRKSAGFALVKFFTRHAIVAVAAYVMMVRLHFEPLGMLAGVSSLGVAAAVESFRDVRWRRFL